jgi:hypothetical protein
MLERWSDFLQTILKEREGLQREKQGLKIIMGYNDKITKLLMKGLQGVCEIYKYLGLLRCHRDT